MSQQNLTSNRVHHCASGLVWGPARRDRHTTVCIAGRVGLGPRSVGDPSVSTTRKTWEPENEWAWKAFVDVSKVGPLLPPTVHSPHRVSPPLCGSAFPKHTIHKTPFRLNHYLGSWEQYSFRDDARRGLDRRREAWEFRASVAAGGRDDMTSTWLRGFVESVGPARATRVLQESGLPRNYTKQDDQIDWAINMTLLEEDRRNDQHYRSFARFVKEKNAVRERRRNRQQRRRAAKQQQ